jgi:uncharacterized delta-60 repeat protein
MLAVCRALYIRVFVIVIALGLVACGGGGGSDGGGGGSDGGGTTAPKTFTLPDQGLDWYVQAVALATDGSGDLYVGGDFTSYNDTASSRIIRLNSDGTADTDFAVGTGFSGGVDSLVPAIDGSGDVYVGGDFTSYNGTTSNRIIRLNSDGTLDSTFDVGTGFNYEVYSIALTTDGSGDVYVGGGFTSYDGTASNYIIRLNSDGTVDTDFAVGTGFDDDVGSLALAADGSGDIYVGGDFTSYDGTTSNYLIRLNSDGTVDSSFDVGTGFNDGTSFSHKILSIAPATDSSGDVYVGGSFSSYNGTTSSRIIRLNSDGTVDSTFNVGTGFNSSVYSIVPTADGSGDVYVGGWFNAYNDETSGRIIRLNSDGTVDNDFAVGKGFSSFVTSLALATDGSGDVYVGGLFNEYKGAANGYLIRLDSNGAVSKTYSANTGFNQPATGIAPAADGSSDVYVGGQFTSYNGTSSNSIIRLNNDGTVDSAFAVGTGFNKYASSVVPADDGSGDVYVGGGFTSYNGTTSNRFIRLNSDGTVDNTFDVGTGFDNEVTSIAPTTDGSGDVYVGGNFTSYNGTTSNRLIRLNSDGTVDTVFGFDSFVFSIVPADDGSGDIYVGGDFASYNDSSSKSIIRLNSDGTVDTAFAVGTGFNSYVHSLALATDGSGDVYAGGNFSSYNGTTSRYIIRLNSDGTVDSDFAIGTGFNGWVSPLVPAADGSGDVYVGGGFSSYNGTTSGNIIRLNSDGTVDSTFVVETGFGSQVYSLAPATDGSGNVYVGGDFNSYRGTAVWNIVSLKPDGSIN